MIKQAASFVFVLGFFTTFALALQLPAPTEGDFTISGFRFETGEILPELKLHYRTFGTPNKDDAGRTSNAVLILHGTGGTGAQFLSPQFAGVLFGPGQLLDITKYYIILPDSIGHGQSSKPSDGLRMHFPRYNYNDMVTAQYRLLTEHHWNNGDYKSQPMHGLTAAHYSLMIMSSVPLQMQKEAPTREEADRQFDNRIRASMRNKDANDMLYQFDASRDYDPSPKLESIKAPLIAINSADDQVNPPELGIAEREIKRVKRGRFILIPISNETRGHGTHSLPALWKQYLAMLLEESKR